MKARIVQLILVALFLVLSNPVKVIGDSEHPFQLRSRTFKDNATFPLSMIVTFPSSPNGPNSCTLNGSPGGDQSPEVSWTRAPEGTQSFVMIMYDVTASFTHWGMYNISSQTTELPANAGTAGSPFGTRGQRLRHRRCQL